MKIGRHLIEEGEVSPDDEAPLPLQDLAELSLEVEQTLEMRRCWMVTMPL